MNTRAKSIAVLIGTLIIGGVLGGLIVGTISQNRQERRNQIRNRGGFAQHMERIIEPKDEAQRQALQPILESVDQSNRAILEDAHRQLKIQYDSLLIRLDTILDDQQLERLRKERGRMGRRGPPPGGPQGGPPRNRDGGPDRGPDGE